MNDFRELLTQRTTHFMAALRVCLLQVLANGGCVCRVAPEHGPLLYPEGWADGGDGARAEAGRPCPGAREA